jgi:hypothetical protein|tara:strand:- start:901 stop:1050 length:150 start_codon:yes stop_codon:yes gene_type:complete
MPFAITKDKQGYWVINSTTKKRYNKKPHKTKAQAQKHLTAISINYYKNK